MKMKDSEIREAALLQAAAILYAKTHDPAEAVRVALELEQELRKKTQGE